MSQDIEKLLESVTPRGAPPELRARVLARVAETLGTPCATACRDGSQHPTSAGTACGSAVDPGVLASSASAPLHTQAEVPQAVAHAILGRVAGPLGDQFDEAATPSCATACRDGSQPPTPAGTACGSAIDRGVLASSASAPPHTQGEVPQAVAHARRVRHRLDTVLAWAVAGLVLLGMGLNFAAVRVGDARMAAYAPPRPEPVSNEQLAMALAEAGPRADEALKSRLVALRWSRREAAGEESLRQYREFLNQTLILLKEPFHAACQEDPEMDVHRRRRIGGHTTDCQRHFGLDYRLTA